MMPFAWTGAFHWSVMSLELREVFVRSNGWVGTYDDDNNNNNNNNNNSLNQKTEVNPRDIAMRSEAERKVIS